ncbi:MliC family protein [Faunimonas sp. B44]|uniref:MliC family protein n=1 Tax=Faunimonas sp. B44 TaxID=3461493 RepID=UPI004044615E
MTRTIGMLIACATAAAAPVAAALADDITIALPAGQTVERTKVRYHCEGMTSVDVEYINAGENALAVVTLVRMPIVFAGVLAASGARYAAGPYVWWTKGRDADFYDLRRGEDASPVNCREQ